MTERVVDVEVNDGVHTITLNSQSNRNALSKALVNQTNRALDDAESDGRVVVLAAVGPSFCAGADLRERSRPQEGPPPRDLFERLSDFPLPVIAVVDGAARAGGIGLVASADIAIGSDRANFAVSEVHRGLIPAVISVLCGERMQTRAMQRYFLTGEPFDAAEAARIGLLTEAVPQADLRERTDDVAASLLRGAPSALRATKDILNPSGADRTRRLEDMKERSKTAFLSPDGQEGIHAFLEKRDPAWVTSPH